MKRVILKIFLWIVGIIAFLTIAAVIAINIIFKPSVIIGMAKDLSAEYLNGRLDIKDADVSVFSTFPHLAFRLDSVEIDNAAGERLVSADRIAVAVNIKKYMSHKRLAIEHLGIYGPYISYKTDSTGRNNWDGLFNMKESDEGGDSSRIFNSLSSSNLKIERATVSYDDGQAGDFIHIKGLDISLKGGAGKRGAGGRASIKAGSITARTGGISMWTTGTTLHSPGSSIIRASELDDSIPQCFIHVLINTPYRLLRLGRVRLVQVILRVVYALDQRPVRPYPGYALVGVQLAQLLVYLLPVGKRNHTSLKPYN